MDASKFNLWRACFSFCHIDSFLSPQEREWLDGKIRTLGFTNEQIALLAADVKNPPELKTLLSQITKPSDRAFLVDQMRVLAKLDGVVSPEEKKKIEEIRSFVMSQVDFKGLEAQIAADEKASYHEEEVFAVNNKQSIFERVHRFMQKKLNAGDYVDPERDLK